MSTHEASPPKGPLQFIVERLSIKSGRLDRDGGGGESEFEVGEIAAMCAGLSDPIARELVGVIIGDPGAVNRAVQELDLWGWLRWRIDWPDRQIKGTLHGRMAAAVVADYQLGGKGYSRREICEFLGISGGRFVQLGPHWSSLMKRMQEAEAKVKERVRRERREQSDE